MSQDITVGANFARSLPSGRAGTRITCVRSGQPSGPRNALAQKAGNHQQYQVDDEGSDEDLQQELRWRVAKQDTLPIG